MTDRLKTLLISIGVVATAGGTVTVWRLRPDVARIEAVDAGILNGGVRTTVAVEGRRLLPDGGYVYGSGHVDGVWRANDSALILDPPENVEIFRPDRQRKDDAADPVDAGSMRSRQDDCGCRGASGTCLVANPDGGANLPAPYGVTLQPGTFGGAGCVRKVCGGVFTLVDGQPADMTWPANCPEAAP